MTLSARSATVVTITRSLARVAFSTIAIGQVGATGKATGYHLHYEVLANGRLLNPLQLLTQKPEPK